jgi:drug/metabolite transporter (DMT)-like permease
VTDGGHRDRGAGAPALALVAAALFGLSAPAAKVLVGSVDAWLLAGLLYLGSGVGLALVRVVRRLAGAPVQEATLARRDLPWLAGAIVTGGGGGPVLLMSALARGSASESSLLLNLEGVFTALLAAVVFREHVPARIAVGMLAITAGAAALVWADTGHVRLGTPALLVTGACVAWAIDNNLTRAVSATDPLTIAALKGAVAGPVSLVIALAHGAAWPPAPFVLAAGAVGFLGYGTSLVLFVRALRLLGTSRTSAYFSTAPFIGAVTGVAALGEPLAPALAIAAALMAVGVWLHLTEEHDHAHVHEPLTHEHAHHHDEHHRHDHPPGTPTTEPHTHPHVHEAVRHRHPHYPDLHHRHGH